jgi:hypothetical protein
MPNMGGAVSFSADPAAGVNSPLPPRRGPSRNWTTACGERSAVTPRLRVHSPGERRRCSSRISPATLVRESRTNSANGAFRSLLIGVAGVSSLVRVANRQRPHPANRTGTDNGGFSVWLKRNAREGSAASVAKLLVRELGLQQREIVECG